jgi:hypothetical protein
MSGKRPPSLSDTQRAAAVLDAQPESAVRIWLRV